MFASAALGFGLLALALRRSTAGRPIRAWQVGVAGTLGLLYYEINAASVAAVAPIFLWRALAETTTRDRLRVIALLSPGLLLPFVTAVALGLRAAPNSENYPGTAVTVGGGLWETTGTALLSGLPVAGWPLSRTFLSGAPLIRPMPLLVLAVAVTVLAVLQRVRPLPDAHIRIGRAWLLILAPVTYAVGATVLQAATQKIQAEVTAIGMVYNFYAVSACAVAACMALALLLVPRTWLRAPWVTPVVTVTFGVFLLLQTMLNANISERCNSIIQPESRRLLQVYSDQAPESERCSAVKVWTGLSFPDYYESSMVGGLREAYRRFYGQDFCTDFVLIASMTAGASSLEQPAAGDAFWWVTAGEANLRIGRYPGSEGHVRFSVTLANAPCPTSRTVVVNSALEQRSVSLSPAQQTATIELTLPPEQDSADLRILTAGPVCRIPTDPREFMVMVQAPVVTAFTPEVP